MASDGKDIQWPKECKAPDLNSLYRKNILNLMLMALFGKKGPKNPASFALVMNYVRIVDAVLLEYHAMRESLQHYVETPNEVMSPLFESISYAESCVSNVLRAMNLARKIRHDKLGPPIGKLPVLSDFVVSKVRDFRNEIQHVDDELASGKWQPGTTNCVVVLADRLTLGKQEILFADLATWIKALHGIVEGLIMFEEPAPPPDPA